MGFAPPYGQFNTVPWFVQIFHALHDIIKTQIYLCLQVAKRSIVERVGWGGLAYQTLTIINRAISVN